MVRLFVFFLPEIKLMYFSKVEITVWVFSVSSPPALLTKLLFPPLADMLS